MKPTDFPDRAGAAVATGIGGSLAADWNEWGHRASVFIAKAAGYQADLESTIAAGLCASWGWAARGPEASRCCSSRTSSSRAATRLRSTRTRSWFARRPRSSGAGVRARSSSPRGRGTAATPSWSSISRGWARSSTNRASNSST